jgi:hypothetical protein
VRVRLADNGSQKNSRQQKKPKMVKIVANVESWKNRRKVIAKNKPPKNKAI